MADRSLVRYAQLLELSAGWSDDPDTKVGCVIAKLGVVLSLGSNTLARGIRSKPERLKRPEKYLWVVHAERNAIFHAAQHGLSLEGAELYLEWFPCVDCAQAIIQSGIEWVFAAPVEASKDSGWYDELLVAHEMLLEAGVKLETWDAKGWRGEKS